MALKDVQCRQAVAKEKPYKLAAGGGLYLLVSANGKKYWRYKYRFHGKEKVLALGVYPEVTLAKATAAHQAARDLVAADTDPMASKKATRKANRLAQENSFKAIAKEWVDSQSSGWSEAHIERVNGFFKNHIYPEFGEEPIANITSLDVLDAIRKMEAKGLGESCYKALAQTNKVFIYAVVTKRAPVNVAAGLNSFLKPKPPTKHHPHVEKEELGKLMTLIDRYGGLPQTRIATKLVMLCFMRSGELRQATWEEIDFEAATWTIPSAHRKGSKTLKASGIPHIVPLSRQAIELLTELRQHTGDRPLMFEGQKRGVPISENTINKALRTIGYGDEQSAHGFRGLASTILNENGFNPDAIERQLSHKEKNQVRRAYDHSQRLPERVTMMQWWSDFLDSKAGSNVVPMAPRRSA